MYGILPNSCILEGFVLKNSAGLLKKYLSDDVNDVCIPEIHADMVKVSTESATFPLDKVATYGHANFKTTKSVASETVDEGIKLEKRNSDGTFKIMPIGKAYQANIEHVGDGIGIAGKVMLKLVNLKPGQLYILTIQYHDGSMHVRFVTRW